MNATANPTGIGRAIRRREDPRLLSGQGRYSDDMNLPDQAYAIMVRSPHAHAKVRGIDTAAARAMPGVLAVLTGADMLADGLHPIPHAVWSRHPAELYLPNSDGSEAVIPPHHCMATQDVLHVGEIVAMAVATSAAAAKDAAEQVVVDYGTLPAVTRAIEAVATDAVPVRGDGGNVCVDSLVGDAAATTAAFARAAHVASLTTWIPRVTGVPMEPRAALGTYDAATQHYTLHAGAGGAHQPKQHLAGVLGVPDKQVRMVMHDVGGNFGTRGAFNPEFALVVWAARRIGRPVKWTCARSEAFVCDYQARDLEATAELALDAEGKFLAMRGSVISNVGAYPISFGPIQKGVEIISSIYHVPAVLFRARAAMTNTPPTRPYRSSGRPEVMFVMERLIDIAARRSRIDRIELRRRNLITEAALPYRNPFGMVYDSGAYHRVMERALELADWQGFPARRAAARAQGRCRGIGVANYLDTATGVPRERTEITIMPQGIVEVVIGTVSQGQGHDTSFAQLMTEFLGVELGAIKLVTGDSDRIKFGGGAHSGRALRLGSIVMHHASREIIKKGLHIASHLLEADVADLSFGDGRFTVTGTDRSVHLFEVARAALERSDLPEDLRGPLAAISDETVPEASFPYGCHVCEVEVDPDTGVVRVERHTAVDDVGRAVNPMIVHGQVHGGIVQGLGQALCEQCVYEPGSGQLLAGSFMDYAMPRAAMFPKFDAEISEVPSTTHPLGIRPAGEGGTTPALAVVINAIVDALSDYGVEHIEMPATAERLWQAMHHARAA